MNYSEDILRAMADAGIGCDASIVLDGAIHRFTAVGDRSRSDNGWYIAYDGDICTAVFGSWKTGEKHQWCSVREQKMNADDRRRYQQQIKQAEKTRIEEQASIHAKCRNRAAEIWKKAATNGIEHNQYVTRKKITAYGARTNERGNLIVPLMDIEGVIHSLQFITPDGTKKFMTGTAKKGHFCYVAAPGVRVADAESMVICEGYATGCSIHQATGLPTVVAFDAGNLKSVVEAFRAKYPEKKIIVAADNDQWTADNPGMTKAMEAAQTANALLVSLHMVY
jgi:putative DNA primase/helicase